MDLEASAQGPPGEPAPWRMVDAGFEAGFLELEAGRAVARLRTDDCRRGRCGACGVCHDDVSMDLVG